MAKKATKKQDKDQADVTDGSAVDEPGLGDPVDDAGDLSGVSGDPADLAGDEGPSEADQGDTEAVDVRPARPTPRRLSDLPKDPEERRKYLDENPSVAQRLMKDY